MNDYNNPSATPSCSVPPGAYMRRLCAMMAADNWLWPVAPMAVCAVLSLWVDARYILVAVMLLLAALPMALALLYFYYGFSPLARWSIMDKTVEAGEDGITLRFADRRMKTHVIARDDVRCVMLKNHALIVMMNSGRYDFLMLPESAATTLEPYLAT